MRQTAGMVLPPSLDLSGRTALVTGAGSPNGIGFATARHLGALGAGVVLAATTNRVKDRARELEDSGVEALGLVGDLTDPEVVADLVDAAAEWGGRLDVLVNNAGMVSTSQPDYLEGDLTATTPDRWSESLRRNLDTAFLVTRAALPHLRVSGSGRVVMVASVTGAVMGMRGEVAYAAAKAGLVGLTRALAVDEAVHGVTVNAVAPGWIATGSQTDDEAAEGLVTPGGRSGTADEVAAAIAYLVSPGAGYTTGQVLVVDGGNSITEERALPR
ncbi:SDR family NAD(P)-dependent oxidoreductase [Pedococcus soli]